MSPSASESLACGNCAAPLRWDQCNTAAPEPCASCGTPVLAAVFPALLRPMDKGESAAVTVGSEATCFYHESRRADAVCDVCGRFLCSLCDVVMHGRHQCPQCIERGMDKGRASRLENRRVMHDNIALMISLAPLLLGWLGLLISPAAIFYALRHWRSPGGLVPRTRIRFIAALLIGLTNLGLIVFWIVTIVLGVLQL